MQKSEIADNVSLLTGWSAIFDLHLTNFISLTDLARYQNSSDPSFTVKNWLRRVTTIDYTDLLHLVILNNLQNTNAELIEANVPQEKRLMKLNNSARRQMKVLQNNKNIRELEILQKQVNDVVIETRVSIANEDIK